jgi:ribonuclease D
MIYRYGDGELTAEFLERRWFAALSAAKSVQSECEVLLEVVQQAEEAWRRSRAKLAELESLRDALGDQLAAVDGTVARSRDAAPPPVMSAA